MELPSNRLSWLMAPIKQRKTSLDGGFCLLEHTRPPDRKDSNRSVAIIAILRTLIGLLGILLALLFRQPVIVPLAILASNLLPTQVTRASLVGSLLTAVAGAYIYVTLSRGTPLAFVLVAIGLALAASVRRRFWRAPS